MEGRVKLGLMFKRLTHREHLRRQRAIMHPCQRRGPKEMRERDFLARGPVG